MVMYANKVNGHSVTAENLTLDSDYWTLSTGIDISNTSATTIGNLDHLIEVISVNGQPVIQGAVTGSGPFVLKFVIEHAGSWGTDGTAMVAYIKANASAFTADSGLSCTLANTL